MNTIEIMAPVGSWESLRAAIQARADSVYFGVETLNMRSHSARNFTFEELPRVVALCKEKGIRAYVTVNSIIYDEELSMMRQLCDRVLESKAHAIIASDISVLEYARSIGIPVHISTQLNVCNLEAVRFFSRFADVVVLARELTLEQIASITKRIEREGIRGPSGALVQVELFAHGALCVSIAGKCYMSLAEHNESANRGKCMQVCRRNYRVTDEQTGQELVVENQYIMSPKDLCTIDWIDRLIEAGVSVFKIEGRGRAPEYVFTVVNAYREAIEAVRSGTYTMERKALWKEQLKKVYNRGFWDGGYYLGKRLGEWSASAGSQATEIKTLVGKVTNYFSQRGIAEISLESGSLEEGQKILITGPTTGIVEMTIDSLRRDEDPLSSQRITCVVPNKVRPNDRVYLVKQRGSD